MVKGVSRQVIVVHSPEPKLFEQAIFILKDDAVGEGITDEALMKEAQLAIHGADRQGKKRHLYLYGAVWAAGGALLTGLGVYDDMAKFAGAGTLVPITGFANSVVAPALEFKTEGFVLGTAAKMFIISGPVIVYGISASVVYGLLYVLFGA